MQICRRASKQFIGMHVNKIEYKLSKINLFKTLNIVIFSNLDFTNTTG